MQLHKRFFLIFSAVLLLGLAGCGSKDGQSAHIQPIYDTGNVQYSAVDAVSQTLADQLNVSGSLGYPFAEEMMFGSVSGYLKQLNVELGQTVKKGDVLAVLESSEFEYDISEQRISTQQAELYVQTLQAQGATSAEVADARLAYQIEQAKLAAMLDTLEAYTLKANFDGRVEWVEALREGEMVNAAQTVCTIADTSKLYAYYSGEDAAQFRFGMDATVTVDDTSYAGKVIAAPDTAPYGASAAVAGTVIIDLENQDGLAEYAAEPEQENEGENQGGGFNWGDIDWENLDPEDLPDGIEIPEGVDISEWLENMQGRQQQSERQFSGTESGVRISVILVQHDGAVVVPESAVHRFSGKNYVNLLIGGIKLETPVEVGITIGEQTEIISGVREGDRVIIN